MVVAETEIIKELEDQFQYCYTKEQNLLNLQNLKQNDARVTFYKHYVNNLDATIRLFILTNKFARYDEDMGFWQVTETEYSIQERLFDTNPKENYKRKLDYMDQAIGNNFYISIFNAFEHSFRTIAEKYDANLYDQQKKSLNSLFTAFIGPLQLQTTDREKFINVVTRVRNSIHNNGVFISPKKQDTRYNWNNYPYRFCHGKLIKIPDIWLHYIKFSKEFIKIFD